MKVSKFFKQFNWRFLLVRILVNAIALAITAAIVPKIYFVDKSIWNWLLMALMLGVLNALLKPILQFLTLQLIFVTYGLVIVLINALILSLLSILFPARFAVDNLWWALVGGLVLGLLSSFLEGLLGLTMPIVPDEPPGLRRQVEEQERQVSWLAAASSKAATEEPALDTEPMVSNSMPPVGERRQREEDLAQPSGADAKAAGPAATLRAVPEPSIAEPDEEPVAVGSAPAVEDEPSPYGETGVKRSAPEATLNAEAASEASISVGPETAPEPHEAEAEDQS
jgi:putative membrane protein